MEETYNVALLSMVAKGSLRGLTPQPLVSQANFIFAIGTKFADRFDAALHDLDMKRHSVQANSLLDTD